MQVCTCSQRSESRESQKKLSDEAALPDEVRPHHKDIDTAYGPDHVSTERNSINSNYNDVHNTTLPSTLENNYNEEYLNSLTEFGPTCNKSTLFSRPSGNSRSMAPFSQSRIKTFPEDFVRLQALLRLKGFVPRYVVRYISSRNNSHVSIGNTDNESEFATGAALKQLMNECKINGDRDIDEEMNVLYGECEQSANLFDIDIFKDEVTEKDFSCRPMKLDLNETCDIREECRDVLPNVEAAELYKELVEGQGGTLSEADRGPAVGEMDVANGDVATSRQGETLSAGSAGNTADRTQTCLQTKGCIVSSPARRHVANCCVCLGHNEPHCQIKCFGNITALNSKYTSHRAPPEDLSRIEVVYQAGDRLALGSLTPDTACNINLMSLQNFLKLGGRREDIRIQPGLTLSNSTDNNIQSPLLGHTELNIYAIYKKSVFNLGNLTWLIIDSDLSENLLSVSELRRLNCNWNFETAEEIQLTGTDWRGQKRKLRLQMTAQDRTLTNISHVESTGGTQKVRFKYLSLPGLTGRFSVDNLHFRATGSLYNDFISGVRGFPKYSDLWQFVDIDIHFYGSKTFQVGQLNVSLVIDRYSGAHSYHSLMTDQPLTVEENYIPDKFYETNISSQVEIKSPAEIVGVSNDELDLKHLSEERSRKVLEVVSRHPGAFSKHQYDIGCYQGEVFRLPYDGVKHHDPYRPVRDPRARQSVLTELERLEKSGVIREVSYEATSGWNNTVFVIPKDSRSSIADKMTENKIDLQNRTKKYRFILDGRSLSKHSTGEVQTCYPKIEELTMKMRNKYVVVADLSLAFYSLRYDERDVAMTSFRFENRYFVFLRAIMGDSRSSNFLNRSVSNSITEKKWQQYKEKRNIEDGPLYQVFDNYADDIFAFHDTFEGLMIVWDFILGCLAESGLKLSKSKTQIAPVTFKILGYQFNNVGDKKYEMTIPDGRIASCGTWPRPMHKRYLSCRLSVIGYFSRCLPCIKNSIAYLYTFLRSKDDTWTWECELEWRIYITLLKLSIKLSLFNPDKDCILACDASLAAGSSLLIQNEKDDDEADPEYKIVNCSNKLFSASDVRKAPVYKELIALLYGLQSNEEYLRKCKGKVLVLTDAKSISYLLKTKNLSESLVAGANFLASFSQNLLIYHLPGSVNYCADLLSRQFVGNDESLRTVVSHEMAEAMTQDLFKVGEVVDMQTLSRLDSLLPTAEYLIKGGKTPVPKTFNDIKYSLRMSRAPEHEYLNALRHRDFSKIDPYHPVWKNISRETKSRGYLIQSEFQKFVNSLNNREISEFMKSFYTVSPESNQTGGGEVTAVRCIKCLLNTCPVTSQGTCHFTQQLGPGVLTATLSRTDPPARQHQLLFNTAGLEVKTGQILQFAINVVMLYDGRFQFEVEKSPGLDIKTLTRHDDRNWFLDQVLIINWSRKDVKMQDNLNITFDMPAEVQCQLHQTDMSGELPLDQSLERLVGYFGQISQEMSGWTPHAALKVYCNKLERVCPDSHTLRLSNVNISELRRDWESDESSDQTESELGGRLEDTDITSFDPPMFSTPRRKDRTLLRDDMSKSDMSLMSEDGSRVEREDSPGVQRTTRAPVDETEDSNDQTSHVLSPEKEKYPGRYDRDTTGDVDWEEEEAPELSKTDNEDAQETSESSAVTDDSQNSTHVSFGEGFTDESKEIALANLNNSLIMSHILLNGNILTEANLLRLQDASKYLSNIKGKCLSRDNKRWGGFFLSDRGILYKERKCKRNFQVYPVVCLPRFLSQMIVMNMHHRNNYHLKASSMYIYLSTIYHAADLMNDVRQSEASCLNCRHSQSTYRKSLLGESRTLSTSIPGTHFYSDVSQGMPVTSEGYRHYILFVDSSSGCCFAYLLKSLRAEEALLCFQHLLSFLPNIRMLTSDGGSCYKNPFSCFCFYKNIEHHRRSSRSESNGLSESYVKLTKHLLTTSLFDLSVTERKFWPVKLFEVINYLNNTPTHAASGNRLSRRALFFNQYNNSCFPAATGLHKEIRQTLENLKKNRDERLKRLSNLYKLPDFNIYDVVIIRKNKGELRPLGDSSALQPTSTQMYRVIETSDTSVRLQSLLDRSQISVAKNKLEHFRPSDREILQTYQSLLPSVFARNLFKYGTKEHPNVYSIHDFNAPLRLQDHLQTECDPTHCSAIQQMKNNSGWENPYPIRLDEKTGQESLANSELINDSLMDVASGEEGADEESDLSAQPPVMRTGGGASRGADDTTLNVSLTPPQPSRERGEEGDQPTSSPGDAETAARQAVPVTVAGDSAVETFIQDIPKKRGRPKKKKRGRLTASSPLLVIPGTRRSVDTQPGRLTGDQAGGEQAAEQTQNEQDLEYQNYFTIFAKDRYFAKNQTSRLKKSGNKQKSNKRVHFSDNNLTCHFRLGEVFQLNDYDILQVTGHKPSESHNNLILARPRFDRALSVSKTNKRNANSVLLD